MDSLFGVSFFIVLFFVLDFFDWSWGGVVAMVQPIQAPMASIATNAMSTGVAMSQILIDSRAGITRAIL